MCVCARARPYLVLYENVLNIAVKHGLAALLVREPDVGRNSRKHLGLLLRLSRERQQRAITVEQPAHENTHTHTQ